VLNGIWLALLGILAAPNIIVSKKPEAAEWIDKLRPYQGWLGVVSLVYGIIKLIQMLGGLSFGFRHFLIITLTALVWALLLIVLGLLLGINVIKTFVKDAAFQSKMDGVVTKIAAKQGKLGLVAIIVGLWIVVINLFNIVI